MTTRTARPLKKFEDVIFYTATTEEDPILKKEFGAEEEGFQYVYATDSILSQLMAAPRSVFSWDIDIIKQDRFVVLNNRDSTVDFLTVSETAHTPPSSTDEDDINSHASLSKEATRINQNFTQQILRTDLPDSDIRKTDFRGTPFDENPFYTGEGDEEGMVPAAVAYRYRQFSMGTIRIIARCELHGWMRKRDEDVLMTCYALNEWDSRLSEGINWRQKVDTQRGAVLAHELKNNSCKLAKWTAQSIIAGADQMRLGYVSRVSPANAEEHVILGAQNFKPKELAAQINLSVTNIWGIIKMISDLLHTKSDGRYVLLKDPNKGVLRLYALPEEEEDEDEVGGDEEEDA